MVKVKKNNKKEIQFKLETTEQFLARGGTIEIVSPQPTLELENNVAKANNPCSKLMTLEEGDFWFSEQKVSKNSKKQKLKKINISDLPPEFVEKYLNEAINDAE